MANNEYPIVLAHGIVRFDELRRPLISTLQVLLADRNLAPDRTHYFRRIRSFLQKHQFEVYHSDVSWASDVSIRGQELAQNISNILDKTGHKKVHIIGHSMGGLDARYAIVKEGIADKVASLTTIGTPHLGTPVAIHILDQGGDFVIEALMELFEFDSEGFLTLTPDARVWFNDESREAEAKNDVVYHVYASSQKKKKILSLLQHSWQIIHDEEGDNDGLVSVASQLWANEVVAEDGTTKSIHQHSFPVFADHLNQLGWWDLNELRDGKWWSRKSLRQRREYEESIRNVYLQIVRDVSSTSSSVSEELG
ncbi:MAG: hypothetical protein CL608_17245 [Anaerolineaceae bacterium]|nr:hypothetical protein [Anaerolineaceae bacterium]